MQLRGAAIIAACRCRRTSCQGRRAMPFLEDAKRPAARDRGELPVVAGQDQFRSRLAAHAWASCAISSLSIIAASSTMTAVLAFHGCGAFVPARRIRMDGRVAAKPAPPMIRGDGVRRARGR